MCEPRPEDLIESKEIKKFCGNDIIKIKLTTEEGQAVTWKDVIDKKISFNNIITTMIHENGIEIYTKDGKVFSTI